MEIQNSNFRLKPGMYAKVDFVVEHKQNTLVVPANAIVDLNGKKGVFMPDEGDVAKFKPITIGMSQTDVVEVVDGLPEGARVVIHDDVLATGGTVEAIAKLIRQLGGEVVGACFVIELTFLGGRERLEGIDLHALIDY